MLLDVHRRSMIGLFATLYLPAGAIDVGRTVHVDFGDPHVVVLVDQSHGLIRTDIGVDGYSPRLVEIVEHKPAPGSKRRVIGIPKQTW
ncbi:hypothetical protein A2652_01515 [Candidatus Giovannonibacteria bacterium RIFCSPHIGHO2_01_FULL_43_140]|nr:MAG: hypothetical protein A2652_01515 [Candidatus Giovannonibacteria bacterium RIFCSPHIGHO2_01_FULL_43_140]